MKQPKGLIGKAMLAVLLPLGLALALGSLGTVSTLWNESVALNGVVNAGELSAGWTGVSCQEFHGWPQTPPVAPTGEVGGQDVATTTTETSADNTELTVTVANAYPNYAVMCGFGRANTGSVPWAIRGVKLSPLAGLTGCIQSGTTDRRVMRCRQLTVIYSNNVGARVEPGTSQTGSLRMHVEDLASEGAGYSFRVEECVSQWNEGITGTECFGITP